MKQFVSEGYFMETKSDATFFSRHDSAFSFSHSVSLAAKMSKT